MAAAVQVEEMSKRFRHYREKRSSLKERALSLRRNPHQDFWALSDINLVVEEGETLGLMGHNGSGKSTLLKCIAAILVPTKGRVLVRGTLAAMLELGSGFHQELSGRENIFLNAALIGVPRKQIEARFDEIVAFAELEPFIDNQVKYYSSGMYARLGFAVAVNVDPDVLMIDEVLAVGDESFQRRCLGRVRQFQDEGRTILIVTHSPDMVQLLCDSSLVLERGRQLADKLPPGEGVRLFRQHLLGARDPESGGSAGPGSGGRGRELQITMVDVEHPGTGSRGHLLPGEPLTVKAGFDAAVAVDDAVFGIEIRDSRGELMFGSNTEIVNQPVGPLVGPGQVSFHLDEVPLLDGTYSITVAVQGLRSGRTYDWRDQVAHFDVMNPGRSSGEVAMPLRVEVVAGPVVGATLGQPTGR
jgi:ABC-2 type transport system ATP-binding protein